MDTRKTDSDVACAYIDVTINMLLRAKKMLEDGNFAGANLMMGGVAMPSMRQALEVISGNSNDGES